MAAIHPSFITGPEPGTIVINPESHAVEYSVKRGLNNEFAIFSIIALIIFPCHPTESQHFSLFFFLFFSASL